MTTATIQPTNGPYPATIYRGDALWHDGPGFYYISDDYPDEGSCGAFATLEEAKQHAERDGYVVSDGYIIRGQGRQDG